MALPVFWEDPIKAWQASGLTQAAYCRQHGLSTKPMHEIIEGYIMGTSNRTRSQDITTFLGRPLPAPPSDEEQRSVQKDIERAFRAQDKAIKELAALESRLLGFE